MAFWRAASTLAFGAYVDKLTMAHARGTCGPCAAGWRSCMLLTFLLLLDARASVDCGKGWHSHEAETGAAARQRTARPDEVRPGKVYLGPVMSTSSRKSVHRRSIAEEAGTVADSGRGSAFGAYV